MRTMYLSMLVRLNVINALIGITVSASCLFWWGNSELLLGGDDTKLEFINAAKKIQLLISGEINAQASGAYYLQQLALIPYFSIIAALTEIFGVFITQKIYYFGVLLLGYYGMCKCARALSVPSKCQDSFSSQIIFSAASVMYLLSPFTLVSIWSSMLPSITAVAFVPWLGYFVLSSAHYRKGNSLLYGLIAGLFFPAALLFPWILPATPILLILLCLSTLRHGKGPILSCLIFATSYTVMALVPFVIFMSNQGDLIKGHFTVSQTAESARILAEMWRNIDYLETITGRIPVWLNSGIYRDSYTKIAATINSLIIVLIFIYCILNLKENIVLRFLVVALLITAFLYGGIAVEERIILTIFEYAPFSQVIRNSFDKVSISISFVIAITLAESLYSFLVKNEQNKKM